MRHIVRYSQQHPEREVIVVLESLGGIQEFDGSTDKTLDYIIKRLKYSVAFNHASFYCISSKRNNIFTQDRKKALGIAKFEEIDKDKWIDLSLNKQEREQLIEVFEERMTKKTKNIFRFRDDEREGLLSSKEPRIGCFIKELLNVYHKRNTKLL